MWAEWLEAAIGRHRPGQRILVLCRTRATLSLVRRLAARRGGWLGLEAATPSGLAQQVRQQPLLAEVPEPRVGRELPADSAMGARIGDRPGLAEVARRWVQHTRQARAVGDDPSVPAWLEELLGSDYGLDEDLAALLELCDAASARGRRLHAGASWDRVVALGFDNEPEAMAPTDRHLAKALAEHTCRPLPMLEGTLEAWEVPDVGAEAATAAAIAAEDPEGTLILVADDASARRVRDTLHRNGVWCAWRGNEALSAHPLANAVRRAAGWFAEDGVDPALQSIDLEQVLSRCSLRRLHPAAEAVLRRRLEPFEERDRTFTRRRLIEVLDAARLLDAPLSAWISRLSEMDAKRRFWKPERDWVRAGCHHLLVRLLILQAALTSRPVDEVLAEHEPEPPAYDGDDFDDLLSELLGDEVPEPDLPASGTLGALKRFFVDCRVQVHDDDLGKAIVGALHRRRHLRATLPRVHEALAGPGVDRGILFDGVDVVAIDDWDGRPCHTLLVLDVHDHGLSRRPAPDPLLHDDEIRQLGALTGNDRVHHRLRTLRRAAARAERTLLLVSRRDAGGREVVPPIQLDMRVVAPPAPIGSYGLDAPLPEVARVATVTAMDGTPVPAEHEDAAVRFLATQATLEWVREGAAGSRTSVDACSWLLPWLGHAEGVPEAGLPDRVYSVSALLQPLARCPWQAFTKVLLGVKPPPAVSADLDPRELGTAVHLALERAAAGIGFTLAQRDPDAVVALLRQRTEEAFDEVLERFGTLSPSRRASARGRQGRWAQHWESWAASRARWPTLDWPGAMMDHPDVVEAEALMRATVPACADASWWELRTWILARASGDGAGGVPGEHLTSYGDRSLPPSSAPDLPALLDDPLLRFVARARDRARYHYDVLSGRNGRLAVTAAAAELPFGDATAEPVPVHGVDELTLALPEVALRFGSRDLRLRGIIDRVEWYEGDGVRLVVVADWKTGPAMPDGRGFRQDQYALRDPQLLVYAMVLERASREGVLPEPLLGHAAAVAHDRVLHTFRDREVGRPLPERPDTWLPVEPRTLRGAALRLGAMVDAARAGRWELRPVARTCPRLTAWGGMCDVVDGCRLRRLSPEEDA
ncbi:MAG: PD-(D/E)XK nuclease family protein [Myxococcales bacterium]|nr:PD-(D/E)XK nuclease family protein [Myxococcales bacterium]